MRLVDVNALGRDCRYCDARVFYTLYILGGRDRCSRLELSGILQVTEGAARNIITILKKWGAVSVSHGGVSITDEGRHLLESIPIRIIDMPASEYVVGRYQASVVVVGVADKVTNGICQRNSAILAGAWGASVFLLKDGTMLMPPQWDMDERDPVFADMLRDRGVVDGDVVLMAGANDVFIALMAAISAALDMF